MAAAAARWNHVWVGTETGILKGGGRLGRREVQGCTRVPGVTDALLSQG